MTPTFPINPANTVSLNTIDLGTYQDASGRTYSLSPNTPVTPISPSTGVTVGYDPVTGAPIVYPASRAIDTQNGTQVQNVSNPFTDWWNKMIPHLPPHLGMRTIVVIIAIGLVLIVAWRLTT